MFGFEVAQTYATILAPVWHQTSVSAETYLERYSRCGVPTGIRTPVTAVKGRCSASNIPSDCGQASGHTGDATQSHALR